MLRLGFLKARVVEMVARLWVDQLVMRSPDTDLRLFPDISAIRAVAILVPHPDDEVIGCYHFINEIGKSVAVDLYYVTDGGAGEIQAESISLSDRRVDESGRATVGMPIRNREWWDFPDGNLSGHREVLHNRLEMLVEYDLVLCPAPTDITPDHAVLADVLLRSVNIEKLLWYRSTWLTFPLSASDYAVCGDAAQKRRALRCFISQRNLALGNTITLSGFEARLCGSNASSIEAFRYAISGSLGWHPVNILSISAIKKLKEWY